MSKRTWQVAIFAVVVAGVHGSNVFATTSVAVGPPTCQPGLVHFSTIQAAVNAVPFGSTVLVCPGTYPEQVVIAQPLNLKGVAAGTASAAVLTVPAGGLIVNANPSAFGPVTAQLLVQNTVGVTVSNLTVDGTGGTCVPGANRTVGIVFANVGAPNDGTTAGKIQNVLVRNQQDGCGLGEGIVTDISFITISANNIHDIDRTGIAARGGKNNITANIIHNLGLNGVALDSSNQATVSSNPISNANQAGILVQDGSTAAAVSNNTVLNCPFVGIWLFTAFNSSATGNKVSNSTWGVVLESSSGDLVQTNTFDQSSADGILDEFSGGGNTVTRNSVNEAPFGVFADGSTGGDTLVPNNLFNVVVTVDPNPTNNLTTPDF